MLINFSKVEEMLKFTLPFSKDYLQDSFKNYPIQRSYPLLNGYCREVVCYMESCIQVPKKHQYVDIKIQSLSIGENTANGLWHLDSSLNYGPYYENYLFVVGENRTEFVENEIEIDNKSTSKEFSKKVDILVESTKRIPNRTVMRYFGDNIHRGVKCDVFETRMLIRLVNTDKKLPSYSIDNRMVRV